MDGEDHFDSEKVASWDMIATPRPPQFAKMKATLRNLVDWLGNFVAKEIGDGMEVLKTRIEADPGSYSAEDTWNE